MAATKTSKSNESYFSRYKQGNLAGVHRRAKLERLIKLQPNNKQLPIALKNVTNYRRKAPTTPVWSHSMIKTAMLMKQFAGKFDKNIFSQKPEDADAARKTRNPNLFLVNNKNVQQKKRYSEFSIAARAHDVLGNLVWA